MKYHYLFLVNKGSTTEEALWELCSFLTDIYEMDDPETGAIQIGGYSDQEKPPKDLIHVILECASEVEEIDWQKQWADFAPRFENGLAHIDLETLGGPVLLLKPGAGFGDLSHPTTRLVLALMALHVKDKTVFDIGCGSGILSIAAILLRAKEAYGIDIERDAVKHSKENAQVNHVETKAHFSSALVPAWIPHDPFVIVMNMIETEQTAAWQSLPVLHNKAALVITSGLLSSQSQKYLKLTKSWGWTLLEEKEEEGWIGFVFSQKPD
jgi:ribosomal protein L11 methyltransferase